MPVLLCGFMEDRSEKLYNYRKNEDSVKLARKLLCNKAEARKASAATRLGVIEASMVNHIKEDTK